MTDFNYIISDEDNETAIKEILKRKFNFSSRLMTKLKQQNQIFLNE